jgi:hypothetical protein
LVETKKQTSIECISFLVVYLLGAVEKVFFNHKVHKEGTKYTKVETYNSTLCDLCENTL